MRLFVDFKNFPTCKNSQKRVKNQKSTDKHLSFDALIQEDIDLYDIYLAVHGTHWNKYVFRKADFKGQMISEYSFFSFPKKATKYLVG